MSNTNKIYFPVFSNIEKEVLELASAIHFTDEQLEVYSLKISDLIVRCSIELESIAKEIYRKYTQKEPNSTGECFNWLEANWQISKKAIYIVSPYFHFTKEFRPNFRPFDYINKSNDDFYTQYNSIKHDRVKNLQKANIGTLIRVLGALFILNIYFNDESILLDDDYLGNKLDHSGNSQIFNFMVAPCEEGKSFLGNIDKIPEECIYKIERRYGQYCFKVRFYNVDNDFRSFDVVMGNEDFQEFAKKYHDKSISLDDYFANLEKFLITDVEKEKQNFIEQLRINKIIEIKGTKMSDYYCAVLNK